MFERTHQFSAVTAVLPGTTAQHVIDSVLADQGTSALVWQARGTLLHDTWWKRWVPPISPAKTMLQLLVPDPEVDHIVGTIVERGRLHQQATGAVFSTPCDHAYFGSQFHLAPARAPAIAGGAEHRLTRNLSAIYCIVGHQLGDRVGKAAIDAGAHGPIVYYCEGRGLRDRLGWLRITKEHEKEVLMVIADDADVEEVFDAMAKAGELHMPGRGFMYRIGIDKGVFNLPSRVSHHHYAANTQQIINAIDHLMGQTHWRDQAVFNTGGGGRVAGLGLAVDPAPQLKDQLCMSALVRRDDMQKLMDMMLDTGAPGINISFARFTAADSGCQESGARINAEYAMLRCVTGQGIIERICTVIDDSAEAAGLQDLCVLVNPVPRVATYVAGRKDYRDAA